MATYEKIKHQSNMIRTDIDVSNAMEDFEKGVANKATLMASAVKAAKKVMKPRMVAIYGGASGGPGKITGAMSKVASVQVKGIWYKKSKIGLAIVGQKTKNISTHSLKPSKAHAMEKWHAGQVSQGNKGKYRVAPGISTSNPGGRGTILNAKPWRINGQVGYDTKTVRKKVKKVVTVTRNPSKIAHLIENGHRFANSFGGGKANAKAYKVVDKTNKQTGNATNMAIMAELKIKAQRAAEIADKKARLR